MALVDEAVGAVAETFVGQREAIEFGENDHPRVWAGEADLLGGLQPIDPRHAEIEENQIGLVDGHELNCVQAVTGGPHDLKPTGKFEVIANGTKGRGRIVGDENSNAFGSAHHHKGEPGLNKMGP